MPAHATPRTTADLGRPSRRGEARRAAILDAVAELVTEVGYERVTVDAIAARARASKTTLYRRWPGKAELVAEALCRRAESNIAEVTDTGTLRDDLTAAVAGIVRTLTGAPSLLGLLEGVRDDATLRSLVRSQIEESAVNVGRTICTRATARGESVNLASADRVMSLAVAALFMDILLTGVAPDPAAQSALVDDALMPILRAVQQ
ncbi:TetR/AcrR family transcriptional regulator [Frankia gtarii]|uniref:TetR/AcrR family transcriptional regulator n=1 Tax=Frankia gtarii TaxID=2950102 RepID=UPI0021BF294F|nr:TetR/AcrR family transcriptional regulator [Frankia gtarii]